MRSGPAREARIDDRKLIDSKTFHWLDETHP